MIDLLQTLGAAMLGLYALWVFYLAIMNLHRANEAQKLRPVAFALGVPVLLLGYLLDVVLNVLVMTVLFLELPQELTISDRLGRHLRGVRGGWRYQVARWVCSELLDQFDPTGRHCR